MGLFAPLNQPIRNWQGLRVWFIGASSGIGLASARALHVLGAKVTISARSESALQDWLLNHPGGKAISLDVTNPTALRQAAQTIIQQEGLDMVVYCAGYYTEQRATAFDLNATVKHQAVNYTGALYMLDAVLPHFLKQGSGHISFISSVAGFRGLPKSLAYGPTKAAMINLAETLYIDLQPLRIGVSLINPGFVQTPLTANNNFHMPALITPQEAAQHMLSDWQKGLFHIHFPKRFTRWLLLLRILPYRLYFSVARRLTQA